MDEATMTHRARADEVLAPIGVWDDVLPDPHAYRARALTQRFQTVHDGPVVFHGMAPCADPAIPIKIVLTYPDFLPTLSFFRQSPEGQTEPHYVHDDRSMGDWTAIYYLNPEPADGDGTAFYRHLPTDRIAGDTTTGTDAWQEDAASWFDLTQWERWNLVPAKFNRLLLFSAALFHARGIPENYGTGEDARLIQIVFGTGAWQ